MILGMWVLCEMENQVEVGRAKKEFNDESRKRKLDADD